GWYKRAVWLILPSAPTPRSRKVANFKQAAIRLSTLAAAPLQAPKPFPYTTGSFDDFSCICPNYRRWRLRYRKLPLPDDLRFRDFLSAGFQAAAEEGEGASGDDRCGETRGHGGDIGRNH